MPQRIDKGAHEAARHNIERSPQWPHVQQQHLLREPNCVCCSRHADANVGKQVHHIFPFHYCVALGRPDLELDPRNLITLCETEHDRPAENHHLLVGHLADFKSSNLTAETDARVTFHGMDEDSIKQSAIFRLKKASKLKPLDEMTEEDKANFIELMDTEFPILEARAVGA